MTGDPAEDGGASKTPAPHHPTSERAKELAEQSRHLIARALELEAGTYGIQDRIRSTGDANSSLRDELRRNVQAYAETRRNAEARSLHRRIDHEGMREQIVRWATHAYFAS